jgi:PHD/YefM family antitoxin component YafN of YafNO toxin-antitoxin module
MGSVIGITELRQNARTIIDSLGSEPVTIVNRSKAVAVLLRPDRYEALLDRLDELDAQLAIATREHDTVPFDVAKKELGLVD